MGVSVANLATGAGFVTYTDRSAYEWALARIVAERLTTGSPSSTRASLYR
jgi:hypothetical protein